MREDIELSKIAISALNFLILIALPCMLGWHITQARRRKHLSDGWIIQILIVFTYSVAIFAEIPALWARFLAYYIYRVEMPDILYTLATWDRTGHLFLYAVMMLLTHTFTSNYIPKSIRNMLS
jgi:hypothetical protein